MKKYMITSIVYELIALCGGVFYWEFTKFNAFEGSTTLSVIQTHYFVLGMMFFLLLLVLEKTLPFPTKRQIFH